MSMQYFGFEDEEIVDTVETITKPTTPAATIAKTPMKVPASSNKISISEIQALLGKDPTVEELTSDSTLNESSFYADEDISINQSQLNVTMEESFTADDSTLGNITVVNGKPRKIIKAERKARKALASIADNTENPSTPSTPASNYKKRIPRSGTKNKENQPPKRKATKKIDPDDNDDDLADQLLQKRFQEIENYKLVVE